MSRFGADEWTAYDPNIGAPTANTAIANPDGSTTPFYLAQTVPDSSTPAPGFPGYGVNTSDPNVPYYLAPNASSAGYPTYPNAQPVPTDTSAGFDWGGMFKTVGGLVNIFGQVVRPQGTQMVRPPVQAPTPTWVWIVGGVAVVGVIGVVIASSGRKSAVAGYKRKRSRR